MAPMISGDLIEQITQCRKRNKNLSTKLSQMRRSRDVWKNRALAASAAKEKQRKQAALWRRRTYSQEQWRQHDLIVSRIRAIPDREP